MGKLCSGKRRVKLSLWNTLLTTAQGSPLTLTLVSLLPPSLVLPQFLSPPALNSPWKSRGTRLCLPIRHVSLRGRMLLPVREMTPSRGDSLPPSVASRAGPSAQSSMLPSSTPTSLLPSSSTTRTSTRTSSSSSNSSSLLPSSSSSLPLSSSSNSLLLSRDSSLPLSSSSLPLSSNLLLSSLV